MLNRKTTRLLHKISYPSSCTYSESWKVKEKEPDIVGMEGDKNDRPRWINTVFRQIVYDILVSNKNPIVNLEKAVAD